MKFEIKVMTNKSKTKGVMTLGDWRHQSRWPFFIDNGMVVFLDNDIAEDGFETANQELTHEVFNSWVDSIATQIK